MDNKKLNVLLIYPDSFLRSGATWSMNSLANQLKMKGVNVAICLPEHGDTEKTLNELGLKYFVVNYHGRGSWWKYLPVRTREKKLADRIKLPVKRLFNLASSLYVTVYIIKNKIDLVHIGSLTTCLGSIAAKIFKRKLVWHAREFLEEDLQCEFCNRSIAKKRLKSADQIIAVSKAVESKLATRYEINKCNTIYNGIDFDRFVEIPHQPESLSKVLLVGRICPGKNQGLLVEAMKILKDTYNVIPECTIVGHIDDCKYNQLLQTKSVKYGIAEHIKQIEHSSNIENCYRDAGIVVVCANREAFGRTTVEGMASGCLIIGASSGGTEEIIRDGVTGLMFRPNDAHSLAERLLWAIINKNEALEIAKQGREYALSTFSEEAYSCRVLNCYLSAMEE